MRKTYITITMFSIFVFCLSGFVQAESLYDVLKKVHSPEELEKFYADERFQLVFKLPDIYQLPEETLELKTGDCDDYARLTDAVLKRLGIDSEIVIIKFIDLTVEHAICAWKEGSYYNYFENLKIVRTRSKSIQQIMEKNYSDFACCTSCEPKLNMEFGSCEFK